MIWVDVAIVGVLVFTMVIGFRRGLMRQIVELLGLIGGVFMGLYLTSGLVADYAGPLKDYRLTPPIVFLIIVGLSLLVAQVVGRVAHEVMQVTFFGWFDKVGGAAVGICKGALWLSILITLALHLNESGKARTHIQESTLAAPIAALLPAAFEVVKAYAHDVPLQEPFDSAVR